MEIKEKTLGARLRAARKAKGLNQTQLGSFLGISAASVSAYETDDANPTPDSLAIMTKELGITFDWLINGEGKAPGEHSTTNETQTHYGNGLDRELAAEVVSFLFEIANELGVTLIPEKAKDLFLMINDEFAKTQQIDRAKVIQLVRLAA